ncbi:hypothetical protein UFOVP730_58 [uncultured Caudovirales phage]|uniref:Phage tail collar domain containing protein n=1 Tax=uncultured Caudovirales phage TaxID=2100421 RepID=A0A6J5NNX7_9CAUD|nr:hypothetical protein UFOVP730_58 [uncultured Caudovirales phage]
MPLETATFINGLVATNPVSTDPVAQADDHIRLIKSTIKATFPNLTGAVTANQATLNSPFPVGGIIMWSGSIATIPLGWTLCNGVEVPRSDGSGVITPPDLRDLFVVGAGGSYAVGQTGGANTATTNTAGAHTHGGTSGGTALTVGQIPSHSHSGTTSWGGDHTHSLPGLYIGGSGFGHTGANGWTGQLAYSTGSAGGHNHTFTTDPTGSGQAHTHTIGSDGVHAHTVDTRSPYYALALIMKV